MRQKKYDIFISYRRSSYDTANLVATRLKSVGYSVFFDMETLRSGKFNEQLYYVIENCTDFILVAPPRALDRCVNDDDWVRLEVMHAMKHGKNIVPIMLNGFTWPKPMPAGMEELCNYNALTASSVEYFDMAMERLQECYLLSKRHFMFHKFAKFIGVCVASLLVLTALLWGVFMFISKDVCTNYATRMVKDASAIHLLAIDNASLKEDWVEFENAFKYDESGKIVQRLRSGMLERIDFIENNVRTAAKMVDTVEMEIGAYHTFLLSLNGINAQDISYSPVYASSYFSDYLQSLETVRYAVYETNTMNVKGAAMHFVSFEHMLNSYYAALLSELTKFPDSSLKEYRQLSKMWTHFPAHYKLGEDEEYYTEISLKEIKLAEEALAVFSAELERIDAGLDDFARDNDTPGMLNDRMKQMDEMVTQNYNAMKAEYEFADSDKQYQKWTKCYFMGHMIPMMISNQQMLYDDGFNFKLSITPEIAYKDVEDLLDRYNKEYPDSRAYVASAKAFFKAVSKNECQYAGVLVYAFKDNMSHPVLKVGDIIFDYGGKTIMSFDELKSEYALDNNKDAKVYRLTDGNLEVVGVGKLVESDIIGFLNLVVKIDAPLE